MSEKATPLGAVSRRQTAALAAAATLAAPAVFAQGTAGTLRCAFWDHWVPTGNNAMRELCGRWGERNRAAQLPDTATLDGRLLDQFNIDWFHGMNRALHDALDNPAFEQRIRDNVARMEWLAAETLQHARASHSDIDGCGLDALLKDTTMERSLAAIWYATAA